MAIEKKGKAAFVRVRIKQRRAVGYVVLGVAVMQFRFIHILRYLMRGNPSSSVTTVKVDGIFRYGEALVQRPQKIRVMHHLARIKQSILTDLSSIGKYPQT